MNIYLGMQFIYCKKDYKKNQIDAILVKKTFETQSHTNCKDLYQI